MSIKFDFSGKTALITGSGRGIGRAVALALANSGANVVLVARTLKELSNARDECGGGTRCKCIVADLSDASDVRRVIAQMGDVDILVNNAAIAVLEPFLDTSVDIFDKHWNTNVRPALLLGQAAARSMISRKVSGVIVNVSSQASQVALMRHTSYCVSKAALDQLTRMMALELGHFGIRANAVQPTVALTEMGKLNWSDASKANPMLDRIPAGRFVEVDEVVNLIMYLCSDHCTMVNGATIPIDGGFLSAPFSMDRSRVPVPHFSIASSNKKQSLNDDVATPLVTDTHSSNSTSYTRPRNNSTGSVPQEYGNAKKYGGNRSKSKSPNKSPNFQPRGGGRGQNRSQQQQQQQQAQQQQRQHRQNGNVVGKNNSKNNSNSNNNNNNNRQTCNTNNKNANHGGGQKNVNSSSSPNQSMKTMDSAQNPDHKTSDNTNKVSTNKALNKSDNTNNTNKVSTSKALNKSDKSAKMDNEKMEVKKDVQTTTPKRMSVRPPLIPKKTQQKAAATTEVSKNSTAAQQQQQQQQQSPPPQQQQQQQEQQAKTATPAAGNEAKPHGKRNKRKK